jgi:colanic acid/amylovoran biosynthesis protein
MKIVITNSQLFNGGDAAIILGVIKSLKREFGDSLQITIVDPNAEGAKKYYPTWQIVQMPYFTFGRLAKIAATPLKIFTIWLNRMRYQYIPFLLTSIERTAFDEYRSADFVISTGGTYLVEQYNLKPRLFELFLPQFAKKPLIFYTQSLGPFRKPEYRHALRTLFVSSALIMVRDERSRFNLLEIGVPEWKIRVLADAAFGLADSNILAAAACNQSVIRRVAISVRHWDHFQSRTAEEGMRLYKEALSRAVEWLVRTHRVEVTFVSTCQGIPEYWAKDSKVADDIGSQLPADVVPFVTVDHAFHRTSELMETLRDFDLVIATRMHMAILALASGVPVLPISYEFKTDELFKALGMEPWLLSIETISESSIVELLSKFVTEFPKFRAHLFNAVQAQRRSALQAGHMIRSFLSL